MKYLARLFLIFVAVIAFNNQAQVMLSGERVTLDSKVLGEQREIQVLLPENYDAEPNSTYPVIYMLDGDYNFHGISGMLDLLANKGQLIPKVILVGIADKGTSAYRKNMAPTGNAETYLKFINEELQVFINQQYRASDNTTIVGHSIGGLFVLNSLLEAPASFDNYVAISPSAWFGDDLIVAKTKEKIKDISEPINLFISLADEVKMSIYGVVNEIDTHAKSNVNWQFKHYPDENHNSTGLIALRDSLKSTFKGWHLAETIAEGNSPEQTIDYYAQQLAAFRVEQSMPAGIAHILIRQHYRQKIADQLPEFIANATKRLPASAEILIIKQASFVGFYDNQQAALKILLDNEAKFAHSIDYQKAIARTYQSLKNESKAKAHFEKALALAKQQKAARWQFNIINEYL